MRRRPPRATRTDTLFPCTTLFRAAVGEHLRGVQPLAGGDTAGLGAARRPRRKAGILLHLLVRHAVRRRHGYWPDVLRRLRADVALLLLHGRHSDGRRRPKSEESRVGKECVITGKYRGWAYH